MGEVVPLIFDKKTNDIITCGAIHEATKKWAIGTVGTTIFVYTKGDDIPKQISICKDSVRSLQFNITGQDLLIADKAGNFFVYNIEDQSAKYTKIKAHNSPIEVAKYITDTIIATGDSEGHLKIWNIEEDKCTQKFHDEKEYISDIAVVDDKTIGVTSGNGVLSLYTINRPKRRQYYAQEDDDFVSVTYDPFCRYFICASSRPKIYVSKHPSLDFVCEASMKSTRPFVGVSVLKTNKCRAVVAAENGTVYIQDLHPNHLIYAWQAHKKDIHGMDLSGGLLLTWSSTNEVKVWDITEKRDEEFLSDHKKKKLKKQGKLPVIAKKKDTFFDELGDGESD
ncbi:hypothetical protein TVAG_074040 [Trichomonas vaginalis G3]|uniref:Uncharacterized protein n=1 Tax=Trichomonas vaginalis (strain ATCC PRA-98 / G3) TaxID=412133 RepID=A2G6I6_TRIV3|nr:ribosomal large subunit biogenesis [Trichomonas vaginalis G3]XP_051112382.1 ribosomal large subunit biogenesis [Trichomonas vaginalis G3]EAX87236.1 hypothetical protein TVAG_074040 [Trichomonas vaginalis G3]KAI5511274.1 ribosomal large subunit biogenesis [Trichomonas vaginalis G3]KAI5552754.1 ribosomal large subunit biogenesis [Trichomonas vaginalis G3]|eukprot:XP_001300166.1 hypothetical protein [Trichomonas vaginalis G3]